MKPRKKLFTQWDRLSKQAIVALQSRMLEKFINRHVAPFSTYYRNLFKEHNVDPAQIRSIDDLQRLPFTSKLNLLVTPEHPDRAKEFVLIPDQDVLSKRPSVIMKALTKGKDAAREAIEYEYRPVFLTSTTGRSTDPVPFVYSRHDMDNLASAGGRLVRVLGSSTEDRLMNVFPYAPHLAFWQTHYATLAGGTFSVSTGGGKVAGTEGNIRLIEKIKPSGIIGMPTFLYHILNQAVEEGRHFENLHHLVMGGEKVPMGMRRKLSALVDKVSGKKAIVVATYGFTEAKTAWGECPFSLEGDPSGYHLYPDLGLFEVIDPDTGDVQPEGAPGELVYTPLDARGSVVLRYRTGDFIDGGLTYEPCPHCGRRMPRLVGNISRKSEVKEMNLDKLKGTLVDFNELEHILDDAEHIGAWQLELRKVNDDPHELDLLILHVEKTDDTEEKSLEQMLCDRFKAHTEMQPNKIHFHDAAAMREIQGVGKEIKEKRLVDNRPEVRA